eukprot:jgi/Mesen1/3654/ME000200S02725
MLPPYSEKRLTARLYAAERHTPFTSGTCHHKTSQLWRERRRNGMARLTVFKAEVHHTTESAQGTAKLCGCDDDTVAKPCVAPLEDPPSCSCSEGVKGDATAGGVHGRQKLPMRLLQPYVERGQLLHLPFPDWSEVFYRLHFKNSSEPYTAMIRQRGSLKRHFVAAVASEEATHGHRLVLLRTHRFNFVGVAAEYGCCP